MHSIWPQKSRYCQWYDKETCNFCHYYSLRRCPKIFQSGHSPTNRSRFFSQTISGYMILPPNAQKPSNKIQLWIIPNFASPQECQSIIEEAYRKGFENSLVDDSHERLPHKGRTSTTSYLTPTNAPTTASIGERTKAIVGNYHLEGLQVQRYESSQKYDPHYDTFDGLDEDEQRNYTAMLYLNNIPHGGGTYFPNIDLRIQPSQGTLVLWDNLLPNGCRDPLTLHQGEPITGSEAKYITTYWFRKRKGEVCKVGRENFAEGNYFAVGCGIGGVLLFLVLFGIIAAIVLYRRKK